jgi:hypothetical protein
MFGLGVVALAFACDGTTTNPTPTPDLATPLPDLTMLPDLTTLVPVVNNIAPAIGPTSGGTSVTISGSGFDQGATVKIGNLTVTGVTVSADGTTITFMTPANLGKPGPYDVIVTNGNSQTTTKTAGFSYFITVTFAAGANVTQGTDNGPRFVQPYDIDKDGTLDLAVAYGNGNTLVTYKGTSAGANISFGVANSRGVNTYPFMVSVGDVNGDGKADLVAPCQNATGQGSVAVLLGDGTLNPGTLVGNNVGAATQKPQWTQLVDLNGDNKLDIVVNLNGVATNNIAHLINQGTATFAYVVGNNLTAGANTYSLAMGDFNKDGKSDIVALLAGAGNNVIPFKHNGVANAPWLTAGTAAMSGSGSPYHAAVGDFDKDGNLDLVTVNNLAAGTISFLKGNGQGGFANAVAANQFTVGAAPEHIAIADLNGDGNPDVVTANLGGAGASGTVSWLLGNGDGTFKPMQNLNMGNARFNSVAVADFNKDGILDLIATDYRPGVVANGGGIVFWKGTGQ